MPDNRSILQKFLFGPDPTHPESKAVGGLVTRATVAPAVPFSNSGYYGNYTTGGQMTGGALPTLYAGSRVDYQRAIGEMEQSSAIMACVQYVQRVFPEAPVRVIVRDPKGDTGIEGHPLAVLLDEPNPFMSGAAVLQALLADYNIHGNAYLLKFRTNGGKVAELWYEPQLTIRPTWSPSGDAFIGGYQIWRTGKWYPLPITDVVHLRWGIDMRNPRLGISPLRSALRTIYTDEEAESYLATVLHNMGSPGAIISPANEQTITPDEAQRIQTYFNSRFTGDGRGSTMVASKALQIAMPTYSPADLDLTKIHHLSESRISGLMGVPPIVAGLAVGLEHGTYSNYGQAREAAYESNILPTMRVFADTFTRALLRDDFGGMAGQFVEFDISDVRALQTDENAIATRVKDLFAAGIIDRELAMTMIGEEPLPGDKGVYFLPRGGAFTSGEIAEPIAAQTVPEDTVPVVPPIVSNGHSPAVVPAAALIANGAKP